MRSRHLFITLTVLKRSLEVDTNHNVNDIRLTTLSNHVLVQDDLRVIKATFAHIESAQIHNHWIIRISILFAVRPCAQPVNLMLRLGIR